MSKKEIKQEIIIMYDSEKSDFFESLDLDKTETVLKLARTYASHSTVQDMVASLITETPFQNILFLLACRYVARAIEEGTTKLLATLRATRRKEVETHVDPRD